MPVSRPEPIRADDRAACRTAIRAGSKSFHAAGLLLPQAVRRSAHGLYAFCRLADDLVDGTDDAGGRVAAVARLRERIRRAYDGLPADDAADRAFAATVSAHSIPEALPLALVEGLEWDAHGRRYQTIGDLHAYAARVAGSVGVMMALVMGVRDADALARASDLGAAMQLTNIARDVGEDARMGRLYLPRDWIDEAGLDAAAFLADPRPSPELSRIVARLLAEADRLYARAEAGIASLPPRCRPAIRAASRIYAQIGREVARNGYDCVTRRARVGGLAKLGHAFGAALPRPAMRGFAMPPLPQTAFLIAAVSAHPTPRSPGGLPSWWDLRGRVLHVLDLIERLREREALHGAVPPSIAR
ncbi:phytoene/squalene synthase family protein [Methylobacterium sp. J-076]|uniref:phytoene/squalene synthase family protein n=1 Tax=Methylobacterium sp. J-076 TaxID=2836655 RepID=UPI001FBBB25A|nr:phytoene/squalene synthase family protein [Methylobacterium sp. J-076]MCJ2013003.1 phytoene/squalene synthase family protein [Methylobacterium sp. J-076]